VNVIVYPINNCVVGLLNKNKNNLLGGVEVATKRRKNDRKRGPKKWPRGPPGRGVLRFSARGYRNPVHFFAFFAVFSKKRAT